MSDRCHFLNKRPWGRRRALFAAGDNSKQPRRIGLGFVDSRRARMLTSASGFQVISKS